MKKLIVKSRLLDRGGFDERIAGIGMQLSPVIWQHERVYLPRDYQPMRNLPRLVMRTEIRATDQPATYALYLKRHIEDSGIDWTNFTSVGDYTEASGIVHQLGFRKAAEISRQRQELWLDDRTVIYLDNVEGLREPFLKIEAGFNDDEPVETLRRDVFAIMSMLGQETFTMQSYFELLDSPLEEFMLPEVDS